MICCNRKFVFVHMAMKPFQYDIIAKIFGSDRGLLKIKDIDYNDFIIKKSECGTALGLSFILNTCTFLISNKGQKQLNQDFDRKKTLTSTL